MNEYITGIVDLIVELSKERKDIESPTRAIYSVFRDVAREVGERMNKSETERRGNSGLVSKRNDTSV